MRTGDEIREIFNLKYNNINSGISPGLNDYEISLYLTEAQKEVIENFYAGSMKGFSFEQMEKIRKNLTDITKEDSFNIGLPEENGKSSFYKYRIIWSATSPRPWRVLYEVAVIEEEFPCLGGNEVNIKPVRHNELNRILMNPFRGPTAYNVLRIDIAGEHELYSKYPLEKYVYRYINYPYPIILVNLNDDAFREENGLPLSDEYPLSIESKTVPNPDIYPNVCIFDHYMEDIIIDRAVELATVGYKENSLQTQLMTNVRKE